MIRAFRKTLDELQLERERPPEFLNYAERMIQNWKQGIKDE